jgi:hypothetical protein
VIRGLNQYMLLSRDLKANYQKLHWYIKIAPLTSVIFFIILLNQNLMIKGNESKFILPTPIKTHQS